MSVVVYSKLHCIECNILKRFLKDQGIQYETRDCSTNPQYLDEVKEMGFLGVPVTVVHGHPVQGLQPDVILKHLEKDPEALMAVRVFHLQGRKVDFFERKVEQAMDKSV